MPCVPQAYKKETLGQEALLREKEEAILMERKRRYGALKLLRYRTGTGPSNIAAQIALLRMAAASVKAPVLGYQCPALHAPCTSAAHHHSSCVSVCAHRHLTGGQAGKKSKQGRTNGLFMLRAEAQQYRERIRKAKLHVYEQYLWRKDMMQDYQQQVEYMRSPAWDKTFSEKIQRCGRCTLPLMHRLAKRRAGLLAWPAGEKGS